MCMLVKRAFRIMFIHIKDNTTMQFATKQHFLSFGIVSIRYYMEGHVYYRHIISCTCVLAVQNVLCQYIYVTLIINLFARENLLRKNSVLLNHANMKR